MDRQDIHRAVRRNNLKQVKALIKSNPSLLHSRDPLREETPILIAALNGHTKVVKWLISKGASLDDTLPNGNTLLHCSASSGSRILVDYVLSLQGMRNHLLSENQYGDTPLHLAVRCGLTDCVRALRRHSSDLTPPNKSELTPIDLAKSLGNKECKRLLEDRPMANGFSNISKLEASGHRTSRKKVSDVRLPTSTSTSTSASTPASTSVSTSFSVLKSRQVPLPALEPMKPKKKTDIKTSLPSEEGNGQIRSSSAICNEPHGVENDSNGITCVPNDESIATVPIPETRRGEPALPLEQTSSLTTAVTLSMPFEETDNTTSLEPKEINGAETHDWCYTPFNTTCPETHNSIQQSSVMVSDSLNLGSFTISKESGYGTLEPKQELVTSSTKTESPPSIDILDKDGSLVPRRLEVRKGEEIHLRAHVTSQHHRQQLNYDWYEIKGRVKEGKWIRNNDKLVRKYQKSVTVYCCISSKSDKRLKATSKTIEIFPKSVWITEALEQEGSYYGKKVTLSCAAAKDPSTKGEIIYQWLKKSLSSGIQDSIIAKTTSGTLTFPAFSPEDDGSYRCQAEIEGCDFDQTNDVDVKGSIEPDLMIVKQPRSQVIVEGGSLKLECQAESRTEGNAKPPSYQWLYDNHPISGANEPVYERRCATRDDIGQYRCRVDDGKESSQLSHLAVVSLAEEDGGENMDSGPLSLTQIDQIKAEKIQRTADGTRYAVDKIAILMANDNYTYHNKLYSSQADLRLMQKVWTKAGFKVFSLLNKTCKETMSALNYISNRIVPGTYVVFFYCGHGCNAGNTDYIIPVNAKNPIDLCECIARATICKLFQSKLCRLFVIMNCCRSTPHQTSSIPKHEWQYNYSNYAIINASVEGHSAFDEAGKVTSFTAILADSVREGGTYREDLDRVLEKMKTVRVSDGVGTYSQPAVQYSTMDPQISFQDPIMMDDPSHEHLLDQLQEIFTASNTPPSPVRLGSDVVGPDFRQLVEDVCLTFECEFSNVLLVTISWILKLSQDYHNISCTSVDMYHEKKEVEIERSVMLSDKEAQFRITSLQKLTDNLRLQIKFLITCSEFSKPHQFSFVHDLHSRPLYSQFCHL